MNRYAGLLALLLGVLPWAPVRAGGPDPANLPELARQRRDAAQQTYVTLFTKYQEGSASEELLYRWSRRWLEAERAVDKRPEGRVAAFRGHWERMRQLEKTVQKLRRSRSITMDRVSAAEYYRVEAAMWLAEAKQGQKAP